LFKKNWTDPTVTPTTKVLALPGENAKGILRNFSEGSVSISARAAVVENPVLAVLSLTPRFSAVTEDIGGERTA
jgi:hypothetical protein